MQGLGGAVVSAVALSLLLLLFQEPAERTKAMGFFGFVMAGGGSIGVLLGGVLTDVLSWHWIFLVNIPVGIAVFALSLPLLPADSSGRAGARPVDVAGAVTVTSALILAVYAIVNGNGNGWLSAQTLGLLGAAVVLLGVFLAIESHIAAPLVPLRLFRSATSRSPTASASSGRPGCSRGSSSRRSTSGSCSATTRCTSGSPSCRRTSSWARSHSGSRRGS